MEVTDGNSFISGHIPVQPTSVPATRENDSTCNECGSVSRSLVIGASVTVTALLLIVTLTIVILTLMVGMKKTKNRKDDAHVEIITPATTDILVTPNEAYTEFKKMTSSNEDTIYEIVI